MPIAGASIAPCSWIGSARGTPIASTPPRTAPECPRLASTARAHVGAGSAGAAGGGGVPVSAIAARKEAGLDRGAVRLVEEIAERERHPADAGAHAAGPCDSLGERARVAFGRGRRRQESCREDQEQPSNRARGLGCSRNHADLPRG